MLEFLPEDIRLGLQLARQRAERRGSRLSVHVGDAVFPVQALWDGGFSVDPSRTPKLRGVVDIYDGPRHLSHCLIIAAAVEDDRIVYEFKIRSDIGDEPPRDYVDDRRKPLIRLGQR